MTSEHISANRNRAPLRVEAQPATWNSLTQHQQEALDKLLNLLAAAVDKLPTSSDEPDRRHEPAWLMNESHSQLSFVDGKRGSGKTTLMLTLTRVLFSGEMRLGNATTTDLTLYQSVKANAEKLKNRVVVVEPIDMEPLPLDTPILAAILARVKQAVQSMCEIRRPTGRNILADDFEDDREAIRFRQVMSRVARSIDSNLQQRRSSLDREQFGQNVQEQEDDRGYLRSDLMDVFRHLSQQLGQANGQRGESQKPYLFLVPFDDVDLNPSRCLELFRIIRTFAPPQMFFLPMGQLELVQRIFQIAMSEEFEKVAKSGNRLLKFDSNEMSARLAEIAYANLRKMVPEAMRISLQPISITCVLEFRPLGADDQPTLGELLGDIWFYNTNLKEVLLNNWDGKGLSEDRPLRSAAEFTYGQYPGLGAFETSARRLVDLWDMLNANRPPVQSANSTPGPNHRAQLHALEQFLKGVIDEDPELRAEEKDRIVAIGPDAVEVMAWNPSKQAEFSTDTELQLDPYLVKSTDSEEDDADQVEYRPTLQMVDTRVPGGGVPLFCLRNSTGETTGSSDSVQPRRVIHSARTRCALVLWHDLRKICIDSHAVAFDESEPLTSLPALALKWSSKAIIPWHLPPLRSFYALTVWLNEIVVRFPSPSNDPGINLNSLSQLLWDWWWSGDKYLQSEMEANLILKVDWSDARKQLASDIVGVQGQATRQEWLKRLIINGMPESLGRPLRWPDGPDNASALRPSKNKFEVFLKYFKRELRDRRKTQLKILPNDMAPLADALNTAVTKDALFYIQAIDLVALTDDRIRSQFRSLERRIETQGKELNNTVDRQFRRSERRAQIQADLSLMRSLVGQSQSMLPTDKNLALSMLQQAEVVRQRLEKSKFLETAHRMDLVTIAFQQLDAMLGCDQLEGADRLSVNLNKFIRSMIKELDTEALRNTFLLLIRQADSITSQHRQIRKTIFELALDIMRTLVSKDSNNLGYQRDLSLGLERVADIEKELGNRDRAKQLHEESLAFRRSLVSKDSNNLGYQRNLSLGLERVADIEKELANRVRAQQLYEQSLEIRRLLVSKDSNNFGYQRDLCVSLERVADFEKELANRVRAQQLYEESLEIRRSLVSKDSNNPGYQRELTVPLNRVAAIEEDLGNRERAQQLYEESLEIMRSLVSKDSNNLDYQRVFCFSLERVADIEKELGNRERAQLLYEESLEIRRLLVSKDSNNLGYQRDLSVGLNIAGAIEEDLGNRERAQQLYEESLEIMRSLVSNDSNNLDYQHELPVSLDRVAGIEKKLGNRERAQQLYEQSLEIMRLLVSKDSNNLGYQRDLSVSLEKVANIEKELANRVRAQQLYEQSLEIRRLLVSKDSNNLGYQRDLSVSLERVADIEKELANRVRAQQLYEQSLEIRRLLVSKDSNNLGYQRDLCILLQPMGCLAMDLEHYDMAQSYLIEMESIALVRSSDKPLPVDRQLLAESQLCIGFLELKLSHLNEARRRFLAAEAELRKLINQDPVLSEYHLQLAQALWGLSETQPDEDRTKHLNEIRRILHEQREKDAYFYPEICRIEQELKRLDSSGENPDTASGHKKAKSKSTSKRPSAMPAQSDSEAAAESPNPSSKNKKPSKKKK